MSITAMKQAVEALTDSVDLVRNEYQGAVELYGCYPTRAARIYELLSGLRAHEEAITALRTAIAEAEKHKPLTDDAIDAACRFIEPSLDGPIKYDRLIARAIEAKIKERS